MSNTKELQSAIDLVSALFKRCETESERRQWLSYLLEALEDDDGWRCIQCGKLLSPRLGG